MTTMRYRRHVFVCTNTRSCAPRGAAELAAALQRAIASDAELVGAVAVTPCGCLGPCLDGPNLVVYPDGEWLAGATEADVPDLLAWLRGGPAVTRLRYEWPDDDGG